MRAAYKHTHTKKTPEMYGKEEYIVYGFRWVAYLASRLSRGCVNFQHRNRWSRFLASPNHSLAFDSHTHLCGTAHARRTNTHKPEAFYTYMFVAEHIVDGERETVKQSVLVSHRHTQHARPLNASRIGIKISFLVARVCVCVFVCVRVCASIISILFFFLSYCLAPSFVVTRNAIKQ